MRAVLSPTAAQAHLRALAVARAGAYNPQYSDAAYHHVVNIQRARTKEAEHERKAEKRGVPVFLRVAGYTLGLKVRRDGVGFAIEPARYEGDFVGVCHRLDAYTKRIARTAPRSMQVAGWCLIEVTRPDGTMYTIDLRGGMLLRDLTYDPGPGSRLLMMITNISKALAEKGYSGEVGAPELDLFWTRVGRKRRRG